MLEYLKSLWNRIFNRRKTSRLDKWLELYGSDDGCQWQELHFPGEEHGPRYKKRDTQPGKSFTGHDIKHNPVSEKLTRFK